MVHRLSAASSTKTRHVFRHLDEEARTLAGAGTQGHRGQRHIQTDDFPEHHCACADCVEGIGWQIPDSLGFYSTSVSIMVRLVTEFEAASRIC